MCGYPPWRPQPGVASERISAMGGRVTVNFKGVAMRGVVIRGEVSFSRQGVVHNETVVVEKKIGDWATWSWVRVTRR